MNPILWVTSSARHSRIFSEGIMWIDRQTYDDLRLDAAEARGAKQALERQVSALDTTMDWMRVRVNQLEEERAQLLFTYTGVKVSVPKISRAPEIDPTPYRRTMDEMPSFEDVGNEAAAALGLSWNPDGTMSVK